ncbi:hypothetical protein RYX36_018463 [Vicia faba]
MTFNGGGKPYPVVYYDGEREFDLGILTVNPTMNIKNILSILSHKIGISPHQFSVFIADKRTNRKIPFTAYLNLATVSRDGGAEYIYVRRYRRFKKKKNISEKLMHLRRDGVVDGKKINGSRSAYPVASSVFDGAEFERRLRILHKKGDAAFLMRMNAILARGVQMGNGGGSGGEGGRTLCKECLKAEVETDAGFHLCVRDEVVVGFKTTAGPIFRPASSSGENGH